MATLSTSPAWPSGTVTCTRGPLTPPSGSGTSRPASANTLTRVTRERFTSSFAIFLHFLKRFQRYILTGSSSLRTWCSPPPETRRLASGTTSTTSTPRLSSGRSRFLIYSFVILIEKLILIISGSRSRCLSHDLPAGHRRGEEGGEGL